MTRFSDSVFARVLHWLADLVCRRPWQFVWPQLLLFAASIFCAARGLTFDMDRGHLVGPGSWYHQIYMKIHSEFPQPDEMVVVAQSASPERNRQFVERLAARLESQTNLFSEVFYKADLTTLGRKALLLAPEEDLEHMRRTLRENQTFLQQLGRATNLNSLFDLINDQFLSGQHRSSTANDFLVQSLPALQRITDQAVQGVVRPGAPPSPDVAGLLGMGEAAGLQSYVTFDHGRIFLLTVRAKNDALNPQAIERVRQLIQETQPEVPGLNAGLTGGPVLNYDEMRESEHDSLIASIVSLVLCSMIFIIAYGQLGRPLKAAFCLIIGLGCTMGYATVAVGHLNILTITFAPMLIGLAIDFGIHFISRYEEEARRGQTPVQAVHVTMTFTGQGIVTGAFTTAAAFLAMALTHFLGIREMGLISGGGLLICLVPMMTMLPVLLTHGRQRLERRGSAALAERVRIENLWLQRPVPVVIATLALCALAALQFRHVFFDYDLLHMQSKGASSVVFEEALIRSASQSALSASVMADNAQQALDYKARMSRLPAVASVQTAADYLGGDQKRKLELVRAIKEEVKDLHFAPVDRKPVQLGQLAPTLWYLTGFLGLAADASEGKKPDLARQLRSLRESILRLRKAVASDQPQVPAQLGLFQRALFDDLHRTFEAIQTQDTSGPMRLEDLPPFLRERFIGVTGKYQLLVYSKKDIWEHENQREFLNQLTSVIPADRVDGRPLEMYHYSTLLKKSYEQAAWYALAAIVVMIFLHFRSLACVILALVPVGIGVTWLLGFMGVFHIPFNPANIMTLPLVIGIGVSNGIQILNRLAEERKPGVLAKSTGKAVLVSGLTAIAGFGSLILAKHQGIRSLGLIMSVGIAACMLAALTFLPALLTMLMRRGWTISPGLERSKPAPLSI
jgi:uncharacterized protein